MEMEMDSYHVVSSDVGEIDDDGGRLDGTFSWNVSGVIEEPCDEPLGLHWIRLTLLVKVESYPNDGPTQFTFSKCDAFACRPVSDVHTNK